MVRRALVVAIAVAALLVGILALPDRTVASDDNAAPGAVVVVGTAGLTWADVDKERTPNLWMMLRDGSSATLSTRSVTSNACPVDGWLGLSSGARAGAPRADTAADPAVRACPPISAVTEDAATSSTVTSGAVTDWPEYLRAAEEEDFNARLGLLADQAGRADVCVRSLGAGAAIGGATAEGTVERWSPFDPDTVVGDLNTCALTLVDVGSVRDPDNLATGEQPPPGTRADQVQEIDDRIGRVVDAGPNGADYLVASLADAGRSPRLQLVTARGPRFGPGSLSSTSTRQRGLVQAQDLTVTALALVGADVPGSLGGAVLTSAPAADNSERRAEDRLQMLRDIGEANTDVRGLVEPFFAVFAYGQLVIYLLVLLVWKGRIGSERTRAQVLGRVRVLSVAAAAVPVSTFLANLVPWWRFPVEMLAAVGSVAGFVVLITVAALRGPLRNWPLGPLAIVAGITALVLATDVITGSRLQVSSLMGTQPVVAGRFYGMGNPTFALFATSSLLLATAVSSRLMIAGRRQAAAVAVGLIGGVAVVVDGAPFWGADGGGPPALTPAVAYLVLAVLGLRMTFRRAAAIGASVVALFFTIAGLDWLREPRERTHLGRFIQAIADGTADDIVRRKAEANIDILLGNAPLTLLVPAALLFVIVVLARPTSWGSQAIDSAFEQAPTLRAGLIALVVVLTIGFLINDSGVAIPAVGATLAVPLLVSVSATHLGQESRSQAATRSARRVR
ncbi:MAG: hypothetical protein ACRCXL_03430 [Dermatophilaceae bacterium]